MRANPPRGVQEGATDPLGEAHLVRVMSQQQPTTHSAHSNARRLTLRATGPTPGYRTKNYYDPAGNVLERSRRSGGVTALVEEFLYDTAGERIHHANAVGLNTVYSQTNDALGQWIKTTAVLSNTVPKVGRVEVYFRDGSLNTVTGAMTHPLRYEYGPTNNGRFTREIRLNANGTDTSEWTLRFYDFANRLTRTLWPDQSASLTHYEGDQVAREVDPDGVATLYGYNGRGEQEDSAVDFDRNGEIDFAGNDRITRTVAAIATNAQNVVVRRASAYVWPEPGSSVSNLLSVTESSLDGRLSWHILGARTNHTGVGLAGGGHRYVTNVAPEGVVTARISTPGCARAASRDVNASHPNSAAKASARRRSRQPRS